MNSSSIMLTLAVCFLSYHVNSYYKEIFKCYHFINVVNSPIHCSYLPQWLASYMFQFQHDTSTPSLCCPWDPLVDPEVFFQKDTAVHGSVPHVLSPTYTHTWISDHWWIISLEFHPIKGIKSHYKSNFLIFIYFSYFIQ